MGAVTQPRAAPRQPHDRGWWLADYWLTRSVRDYTSGEFLHGNTSGPDPALHHRVPAQVTSKDQRAFQ